MDARELRIGSLIKEEYSGILQVVAVNSEFGYLDLINPAWEKPVSGRYDIDSTEPIPLSEEWLLKFGFEKNGIRFSKDWFYLWEENGRIVFALAEMQESKGNYLIIQHVHQLQNLFYSLCGEELEIKK